ncbi:MAG: hypothetical protein IJU19_00925 [Bacteroidales bacterium]|nr:hypothetical protein [Bacteroidales bacterium]
MEETFLLYPSLTSTTVILEMCLPLAVIDWPVDSSSLLHAEKINPNAIAQKNNLFFIIQVPYIRVGRNLCATGSYGEIHINQESGASIKTHYFHSWAWTPVVKNKGCCDRSTLSVS